MSIENNDYPQARLKITRSGKGVLILIPTPELGVTKTYITSKAFVKKLIDSELKFNMLGCSFLADNDLEQFMSKEEKEIVRGKGVNVIGVNADNPMSSKAGKERADKAIKIKDEW